MTFADSQGQVSNRVPAAVIAEFSPAPLDIAVEAFLQLTPKEYRELTGERLGPVNAIKLKMAQKKVEKQLRKGDADISEGVYILLAILGLGWVAMGLLSDFSGSDWIVNLILTILCWLPGLIHALIKKSDYY
jgi:uncharacterized membrane protein YqaE (UPF0057 family)